MMSEGSPLLFAMSRAWLFPGMPIKRRYVGRRLVSSKSTLAFVQNSFV